MLQTLNVWTRSFDDKKAIDIIYTDFSKAFDRVPHKKLLDVLRSFGISGANLSWIRSFLTGRNQSVTIDGLQSSPLEVISGVPQGSVVGPLFFILFIEDVQSCCLNNCNIGLYADDSKLYSSNANDLQESLNRFEQFVRMRQLQLAANKCQHLTISKKDSDLVFFLEGQPIAKANKVKDLGIVISSDLKWSHHITQLRRKGYTRCYQILRSFRSKNIWIYIKAYITYVRPILETDSVIWSPHYIKDVNALESVQRLYLKSVCRRCNLKYSTYADRLNALGLKTLEYRRWYFDIVFVYKLINNLVDLDKNDFFSFETFSYNLRRHNLYLKKPNYKLDVLKYFFANRVINPWNNLPSNIVNSPSLDIFRKRLNNFNLQTVQSMTICL